jgi:biotin carboxyl carrier protein
MSKYYVELEDKEFGFEVTQGPQMTQVRPLEGSAQGESADVDLAAVHAIVETGEGLYSLIAGGKSYQVSVSRTDTGLQVLLSGHRFDLRVLTEREWRLEKIAPKHTAHAGPLTVKSPMPGLVKSVHVAVGDAVSQGSRLLVLEAMKMENEIMAAKPGVVTEVSVTAGTVVEGGQTLLTIE